MTEIEETRAGLKEILEQEREIHRAVLEVAKHAREADERATAQRRETLLAIREADERATAERLLARNEFEAERQRAAVRVPPRASRPCMRAPNPRRSRARARVHAPAVRCCVRACRPATKS